MAADRLAAAIASAEGQPVVDMARIQVMIASTGRPAAIEIPADATDAELAELCGFVLTQVMLSLRQQRSAAPRSRILVPS